MPVILQGEGSTVSITNMVFRVLVLVWLGECCLFSSHEAFHEQTHTHTFTHSRTHTQGEIMIVTIHAFPKKDN
jgi:hypothetical protein